MANALREKQRVMVSTKYPQILNGSKFATVTRVSRECVHLRLDNGQLAGPVHYEYLEPVSKFVEGDHVFAHCGVYEGRRGTVQRAGDERGALAVVAFDPAPEVVSIYESQLCLDPPPAEQRFNALDWVLIGGRRKGQVVSINKHIDDTQTYSVRVSDMEIHHKVKAKDLIMTAADAPEPPHPAPVFKRPMFAFIEGQRVIAKQSRMVGRVEKRLWKKGGAFYDVVIKAGIGGKVTRLKSVHEQYLEKYWFKVGEMVLDVAQQTCHVASHSGTTVEVSYGNGRVHILAEWQVTPLFKTEQEQPAETLRLLTALNRSNDDAGKLLAEKKMLKSELEQTAKSRDEWKTLSNDYQIRRDTLKVANDQLSKEVAALKEQVAILKPIVITGVPVKLDINTPTKDGPMFSSVAIQLNTGAGVIDISTKTINSDDVMAIRALYHAQSKHQGMITVTIAAR